MPLKDVKPDISSSDYNSDQYQPLEIEARWQTEWKKSKLAQTQEPKESQDTFYALSMFPYPSGTLHMGHVRNYVITDVIARMKRMNGFAVLHPMGWDAFGLPAENAAIERGIDPQEWTTQNIVQMRTQLDRLGLSIDWEREQTTCSPNYYRWTQYIFLELYEAGLAYQKKATVNWDPIDETVLANEQVDKDGKSWRSGAIVQKRELKQWFLKITSYAENLLEGLQSLEGWPERVQTMQKNWIGKSNGIEIDFYIEGYSNKKITVFTTRPETIYGVTYLVISPDNRLIYQLATEEKQKEIDQFNLNLQNNNHNADKSIEQEKLGISVGINAINPINNERIPIWFANYVVTDYGTGAVMAVPGHDERDYEFSKKYGLPIKLVISPEIETKLNTHPYTEEGYMTNSEQFNGKESILARELISEYSIKQGWSRKQTRYRLRDWLISRQRYWGCPIPIIHCSDCGIVKVPKEDLPVELPSNINLSGEKKSKLSIDSTWADTICPKCGKNAKRETDTMDTFMCSSWYFLRFADPNNKELPFNKDLVSKWLPVDQYVGGIEHAILHLLYARFLTKALFNRGIININEPFERLLTQGMVQGITYRNAKTLRYIAPSEVKNKKEPLDPNTGDKLEILFEKMSKSKHNGVNPQKVINRYGADTARMFVLFKAPPEKDLEWDEADVEGQYRFLQRLYKLVYGYSRKNKEQSINLDLGKPLSSNLGELTPKEKELRRSVHQAILSITEDLNFENQFNTAISELMKLSNSMNQNIQYANKQLVGESFSALIKLLAPFAPHIAEEFWEMLGGTGSVHQQTWPKHDSQALITQSYELVIQIKGKVRGKIEVPTNSTKIELEKLTLSSEIATKWLEGKDPKRIIVVPGKLINLVI